jgi:Domain of unknown function (DUF4159)
MSQPLPPPPIEPFSRLQAADGLLVTAEHWQRTQAYHRTRQNLHYQSLHRPGIVCGLGVQAVPAPTTVAVEVRDNRWVEVQPGIAINCAGNPIVVSQPVIYRIATENKSPEPITVYLALSYVDPDELRRDEGREWVQEQFRIDEKLTLPDPWEVEICRVLLPTGSLFITQPADVFFPGYCSIDLRYRTQVRPRAAEVRIAQVKHSDPEYARNFFYLHSLVNSIDGLFPSLEAVAMEVELESDKLEANRFDLLYLSGWQFSPSRRENKALEAFLEAGGVLLVDAPPDATDLINKAREIAAGIKTPLEPLESLRRDHPLRNRPFLFAAMPVVNQQQVRVECGGGLILVTGDLASAWGLDAGLSLSRLSIRTAQELGINILHYARCRRQWMGLSRPSSPMP